MLNNNFKQKLGKLNVAGLKKYGINTSWILFARISMMLISFISTLYIARSLGPSNYGEIGYAISFVALFSFIASFGIDSVLYRELIKYPEQKNSILGSALAIRLTASLIALTASISTAFFFSTNDVSFILIILLSTGFLFQSFGIINYEFSAAVNARGISLLSILITLILNILKITVIYFGNGVIYLALILLLESILYAAGYIYLRLMTFGSIFNWTFSLSISKRIILDSWPFIFTAAFTLIYSRIDQVMIKHFLDSSSVGIYDAAVRLSELWYFIPTIIITSLFPAIINAKKHSFNQYRKRLFFLLLLILAITVVISIPISYLSQPIVSLVFGSDFIQAATVLNIYIWAFIPISIIVLFNHILLAENARTILFCSSLLGMTTNVVGNYLLIPHFQAVGAAIATLISSTAIVLILLVIFSYKYFVRQ